MTTHPNAPRLNGSSPWGQVDCLTPLGPDACSVNTPSHGGIWITPEARAKLPAAFRETAYSRGGWFEEDSDWAIPYHAFQLHQFEGDSAMGERNRVAAVKTLAGYHPGALEAISAEVAA